jgi:hypothetical protein
MVCSRCSCRHEAQICVRSLPWQLSASWSAQRCFDELTLDWCSIEPDMRIGSESRSGIVYKIAMKAEVHLHAAAMKLMIHDADAENEVTIATYLSDRVKSGQSKQFPTVFGSAICQQTALDPTTDFGVMVKERWQTQFPTDTTRETFPTRVLVSELMFQDLLQYFNAAQTANCCEEAYIVSEVVEALKELVAARVHHADLHLGNVLLQRYNGTINVLIHDFGSSEKDCNDVASYELDLTTFLDHIVERGRFASEIKQIEKLCEGYGDSFEGFNEVLEQASSMFKALFNKTT